MEDLIREYQQTAHRLEDKILRNKQHLSQVRGLEYQQLLKRTVGLEDMLMDVDYALTGMSRSIHRRRRR